MMPAEDEIMRTKRGERGQKMNPIMSMSNSETARMLSASRIPQTFTAILSIVLSVGFMFM